MPHRPEALHPKKVKIKFTSGEKIAKYMFIKSILLTVLIIGCIAPGDEPAQETNYNSTGIEKVPGDTGIIEFFNRQERAALDSVAAFMTPV